MMMTVKHGLPITILITNVKKHLAISTSESVLQRLQLTNNVISLNAKKLANQDLLVKLPNVFSPTMEQRLTAQEPQSFVTTKRIVPKIDVTILSDVSLNTEATKSAHQEHNVLTMLTAWTLKTPTNWQNNASKQFVMQTWEHALKFHLTRLAKEKEENANLTVKKLMLVMLQLA